MLLIMCFMVCICAALSAPDDCSADTISLQLCLLKRADESSERIQIIAFDLWDSQDERVGARLSLMLSDETTAEAYYIAQYLANRGDTTAMHILCDNALGYQVSSQQWSYTLRAFGKYLYQPALPVLVGNLNSPSLNVIEEAIYALRLFFPDSPEEFSSPDAAAGYFCSRILRHQTE